VTGVHDTRVLPPADGKEAAVLGRPPWPSIPSTRWTRNDRAAPRDISSHEMSSMATVTLLVRQVCRLRLQRPGNCVEWGQLVCRRWHACLDALLRASVLAKV
jgi:hypothetical protein